VKRFDRRLAFARRLRALIAVGVIALPGGATATSLASEVDSQDEGVSTQPDAADDQVESGSEIETALPVEVDPLPDPEQDVSTGLPDGGEPPAAVPLELGAPQDDAAGAESVPAPVEAPALPQPPVSAPSPPETAVPEPAGKGSAPHVLVVGDPRARRHAPQLRLHASDRRQDTGAALPDRSLLELAAQPPPIAAQPPPTAARPPPTAARPPAVATEPPRTGADSGAAGTAGRARFHVVQPGESLWSIAADMLGSVASAEAIARRAHRLWALNKTAIGTGDPDVLPAGVTLRLR